MFRSPLRFNINFQKRNIKSLIRQHVNPLKSKYQSPGKFSPDWIQESYSKVLQPFIVDIGCAKGSWAIEYGTRFPDVNVLGVDIRQAVIDVAMARKKKEKISNTHFVCSNINVDISRILDDINALSRVELVAIQFPDPHYKASHKKRRVVNEYFVHALCTRLRPGTQIFLQSDVHDVLEDMVHHFSKGGYVQPAEGHSIHSLLDNPRPFDVLTARERSCLANNNDEIYRMLFTI